MDILTLALFFALVATFVIRAWKVQGWLSGRDRWSLLTSFVVAATIFVMAPLLINWVIVPTAFWFAAVALLTGGVAGTALRWPELAWFSGTRSTWRAIRVGLTLLSCTLIVGVAVI